MTKIPAKQAFLVYHSKEYVFLRIVLLVSPLLCVWEAVYMRLYGLYFFACMLLLIQIYTFSIINQKLIIDTDGICVKRPFRRTIRILWSEMHYTGTFIMVYLGSHTPSLVYYFSKKPVYTYSFEKSHILPKITEDFVFVLNQPEIKESVQYFKSATDDSLP